MFILANRDGLRASLGEDKLQGHIMAIADHITRMTERVRTDLKSLDKFVLRQWNVVQDNVKKELELSAECLSENQDFFEMIKTSYGMSPPRWTTSLKSTGTLPQPWRR